MFDKPSIKEMFIRWGCDLFGHDYDEFADRLKRRCRKCGREEWLHSNEYPRIGEPKYFWKFLWYSPIKEVSEHER